MKRLLIVVCVGLVVAWVSVSGLAIETGAAPGETAPARQEACSTVLDGVFTAAQALRGQRVYSENCQSCHGSDLRGDGDMAPSIAGNDLIVYWTDVPVGSLFERIKGSMPADGPGRLSDEEYTDVVAFLLDASSYPAGEAELPADKAALDEIMIVAAG